jgi:hypothetical protein
MTMFDSEQYRELHETYSMWRARQRQAEQLLAAGRGDPEFLRRAINQAEAHLVKTEQLIYRYIWQVMGCKRPLERSR